MKNYRKQNGCHNCKAVFVLKEYDGYDEYFCTLNAPKRPPCLSVLMDECSVLDLHEKLQGKWGTWAKDIKVAAYGICDLHIEKK